MRNKRIIGVGIIIAIILAIFVLANVSTVTLLAPSDNLWTNETNNTLEFSFRFIADTATETCTLEIDGEGTNCRTNASTQNDTDTVLYSSCPLVNGTHTWNVRCGAGEVRGTERTIKIDTITPSTSHDAPGGWQSSDVTVTFTNSSDDGLSPITIYSCIGASCAPTAQSSVTATQEGNNTIRYYSEDEAGNQESISTTYVALDKTNLAISLSAPADATTFLNQNTFNFTFTPTDALSGTLDCDLKINGVINQTNSSVTNNTETKFENIRLGDGSYTWLINCSDLAGNDNVSETRTLTVDVAPHKPVVFTPDAVTSASRVNIYGYVNRSQYTTNVTVYAQQLDLGRQNVNSTLTTEVSNQTGTAIINDSQVAGSDYFYINTNGGALPTGFGVGNFTEFSNHQPSYWIRYQIIAVENYGDKYKINISPTLREAINITDSVTAYNGSRPTGWFNISVPLYPGNNTMKVTASRLGTYGLVSDVFYIHSDQTEPTINLTLVTNYSTNTPTIQFTVSDDYGVNISTILVNISNSTNSTIYNSTQVDCTSLPLCELQPTLGNGYYNITVNITDFVGSRNTTNKTFLVNTQEPTIQLVSPSDNYEEDMTNNLTLSFNATDLFDSTLNCSLYINSALNQTNETVQTGTTTLFNLYNLSDATYSWNVTCQNSVISTNTSETRSFTIDNIPDKAKVWPYEVVTIENTTNIVGVIGKNNTLINATVEQGELMPYYNTTTSTQDSTLNVSTTTLRQAVSQGEYCIYINKTLNSSFLPGRWIEFSNHNKSDAYFARYNITNQTNDWGEGENQFYTQVCLQENLTANVSQYTLIGVYDTEYPKGWFNITVSLRTGANNITLVGSRLGLTGPSSDLIEVFRDDENPIVNLSTMQGNSTISTPTLNFILQDDYNVSLQTLFVNITNGSSNTVHVWSGGTAYNTSNWTMGANVSCTNSLPTWRNCTLIPTLNDGIYNFTFMVNDSVNYQNITYFNNFIVETTPPNILVVEDEGITTSTIQLFFNWTNVTSDIYFNYYEVALGRERYQTEGYNSSRAWFSVGANISINLSWNITPGYVYYFHVRVVDVFDNAGNVTISNGVIYEDNTPPQLVNMTLIGTSDNNAWTNNPDELRATWNFTDNETGISHYEYAVGNTTYPVPGWNTIKNVTQTNYSNVTAASLTLEQNVSYYFSVRARNNYQYGYGWSDWYSSSASIRVDTTTPIGGIIYYTYGEYTANSITMIYGTGEDIYSGIDRAALMEATAPMQPDNGGTCGGYSSYSEITNATLTNPNETTTYTYNGLANGNCYKFALYVWDEAGNKAEYYLGNQIYNVSVDTTPPTAFSVTDDGHLTASKTMDFSWDGANDPESGIDYYEYTLTDSDGTTIVGWANNGLTTSIQLANLNLTDENTYYLSVRAWNNIGLQTNSTSDGIIYLDLSTPASLTVMSVDSDTNSGDGWLDLTNSTNTTINLTGEQGLSCVWSYYDIAFTQPSNATNYSWWCDNSANATGQYQCIATGITEEEWNLHVTCRDTAGNKQTQNENTDFTFIKENAAPQINITYPENNSVVNGVINASATIWDASSYNATYELKDPDNNSVMLSGVINDSSAIELDLTNLEGEYTFIVNATDAYNHSSNASISFVVDNNIPTVNIVLSKAYYGQDFNITLRATLFTNLTYNITNTSGNIIQSSRWDYSLLQNTTTMSNLSVNLTPLSEETYTITAAAIDNESNTTTDTETFTVDKTAPEYKGAVDIEPDEPHENDSITLYLNWKELVSLDEIWVRHNANGSFVNYTATATTPGTQIYENATRYKIDILAYLTTVNDTITYTWYARDSAGNEANYSTQTLQVENRPPIITTTSLPDAFEGALYEQFIYFEDLDDTQKNITFFNCTVDGPAGMNATIQSNTICLVEWGNPVAGNYSVNITVSDYLNGGLLNSTIGEFNLSVPPSATQNNTVNTSHTMTLEYSAGGEVMSSTNVTGDVNITLPEANLYTVTFEVDNLIISTDNFNVTNNMDVFFQLLNNNTIDNNNTDIGPNRTYRPLEAYAFRITSSHNGNYTISFNYSEYGVSDTSRLTIFKFGYNENTGEINYSDQQNMTTSLNTSSLLVYTTVSNFSTFILAYDTSEGSGDSPPPSNPPSGGRRRSSSSFYYVPPATCDDNISNQGEIGVDCGGPCDPCQTCHDRVQNQGETGVDCGGPCLPCQPATCTDGVINDGEEGVDCGGPCLPCPGCENNYLDEGEEGMDCGGVCPNECEVEIVETVVTETQIVETPVKTTPSYVWLIIIGITLFGGITALWIYNREERVVKETTVRAEVEEKELEELKDEEQDIMSRYVYNYMSQGLSENDIKNQLVVDGFKEHHINTVMVAVLRDKKILEIQEYFDNYADQGYTVDELKDWVLSQGVDQNLLEEALAKRGVNDNQGPADKGSVVQQ